MGVIIFHNLGYQVLGVISNRQHIPIYLIEWPSQLTMKG